MDESAVPAVTMARSPGVRLRRLRLSGPDRRYDVDFRSPAGPARPLSIIAGAFSTGKTTILEFIDYCLGASDHPRHPEVMPKVREAILEVDLSGVTYLIERPVGEPSVAAFVRVGRLDGPTGPVQRRPLRPAGSPESLSSLLLTHCKLDGVRLRDTVAAGSPSSDPLSFRDLMPLCFLPNERLDSKNLLFESNQIKHLKLRQVFDVVFDVHDDRAMELGRRIKEYDGLLVAARSAHQIAREIVADVRPGEPDELRQARSAALAEIAETEHARRALDERCRAATGYADDLRERHRATALRADRATAAVRDLQTRLRRMVALRAQYADDVSKLTMVVEAHRIFDGLPAPQPATAGTFTGALSAVPAVPSEPVDDPDIGAELRAARARLAEITDLVEELEASLPPARAEAARARAEEDASAAALDAATVDAVTPLLGERDALARRERAAAVALERAEAGLRLTESLRRRADDVAAHAATLATLREELGALAGRQPERTAVIERVSQRYQEILAAWRYPKLSDAYIGDDLTPFVRGRRYTTASSGGRTLISLAWQLAVFEIAWETDSSHPGFLLLDSPQKNLGQPGGRDAGFPDAATIAEVYRHLRRWLAGPGAGAQVVIADNAPPDEVRHDVIVRFSRRPDRPPYGLIDDDTA